MQIPVCPWPPSGSGSAVSIVMLPILPLFRIESNLTPGVPNFKVYYFHPSPCHAHIFIAVKYRMGKMTTVEYKEVDRQDCLLDESQPQGSGR